MQEFTLQGDFWSDRLIGPFFLEDTNERTVNVNENPYEQMIATFCSLNIKKYIQMIVIFNIEFLLHIIPT